MNYFVYILYSKKLDRFYIGSTQDIEERLKSHLFNHTGFTSRTKDWEVCYSETYASKNDGLSRERQLKKWKSRDLLEKLIQQSKGH
jgi:putative endonuclease